MTKPDDLHDCPKNGCPNRIPFERMACWAHWSVLPPELRSRVNRAWRTGDLRATIFARHDVVTFLNGEVSRPTP